MNVTLNNDGGKTLVVLDGRLDTTNVEQFQKDIAPLMEGEKPDIEIDCTNSTMTSMTPTSIFHHTTSRLSLHIRMTTHSARQSISCRARQSS